MIVTCVTQHLASELRRRYGFLDVDVDLPERGAGGGTISINDGQCPFGADGQPVAFVSVASGRLTVGRQRSTRQRCSFELADPDCLRDAVRAVHRLVVDYFHGLAAKAEGAGRRHLGLLCREIVDGVEQAHREAELAQVSLGQ